MPRAPTWRTPRATSPRRSPERGHAGRRRWPIPPGGPRRRCGGRRLARARGPIWCSTSASRSTATRGTRRCCRRCSISPGCPTPARAPLALGLALRKDVDQAACCSRTACRPPRRWRSTAPTSPTVVDAAVPADRQAGARGRLGRHHARLGGARSARARAPRVAEVRARYHQPALVERFIEGRELYVSLLGNRRALPRCPCTRSTSRRCRRAAAHRHLRRQVGSRPRDEYHGTTLGARRALDDAEARARCEAAARAAFAALELRDYARVDLRLAADGTPYVIDVNPNCDLSAGGRRRRAPPPTAGSPTPS